LGELEIIHRSREALGNSLIRMDMTRKGSKKSKNSGAKSSVSARVDDLLTLLCEDDYDVSAFESKLKDLESQGEDCGTAVAKKLEHANVHEQSLIIDKLLPRLEVHGITKTLTGLLQKDTVVPKTKQALFHFLIRSGALVDNDLFKRISEADGLASKLCLNIDYPDRSEEREPLISRLLTLPEADQVSVLKQVLAAKEERCLEIISHVFNGSERLGVRTVEMIKANPSESLCNLLSGLLPLVRSKALGKTIRQTVYSLKRRGFSVQLSGAEEEAQPVFKRIAPASSQAFATSIDAFGERLAIVMQPRAMQGQVLFQFLLSDIEGIKDLPALLAAKKDFQGYLNKIRQDGKVTLIDIDPDYCRFLIEEASKKNVDKGTPLPPDYSHWKSSIKGRQRTFPRPIIYDLIDAQALGTEGHLMEKVSVLFDTKEMANWILEPKEVQEQYRTFRQAESSPVIVSPHQKDARLDDMIKEAARSFFSEGNRKLYQRRLEEMALIFHKTGRTEAATIAILSATELGKEDALPERVPFALQIIKRSFDFFREIEKEAEKDRLITLS
jgi:hypothetical protein